MRPSVFEIEAATALGWPAACETDISGWRVFSGSGYVGRTNSCWPLSWSGDDLAASLDAVEAHYRALGLAPQFKLAEGAVFPPELEGALTERGYHEASHVAVMLADPLRTESPRDIEVQHHLPVGLETLIAGTSAEPGDSAERIAILRRVPIPSGFATVKDHEGAVVAGGICCWAGKTAGIAAMRTLGSHRRQGLARQILLGLMADAASVGVRHIWLQVETSNFPAIALYKSAGFETVYHYSTLRRG
jgi:N-acetylglutamate synthase